MLGFKIKKKSKGEEEKSGSKLDLKSRKPVKKNAKPFRQWTKKDRYLVAFVLAATTISSAFLGLSSRSWKLPGFPRISAPTISFQKTYVLSNDNHNIATEAINEFREKTNPLSGIYGFYVYSLEDPREYGLNEEEVFTAASLIKLPVMIAAFREAEEGNFNLEEKYILKDSDKIGGSGSIYGMEDGASFSYRELLEYMGKQSDNTAFNVVRKALGDEIISETIEELGMKDTNLKRNETSPKDISLLFQELWSGGVVTRQHRDEILEYLTDTAYEAWLPIRLPSEVRVSHKYGREVHVVNDAGIVFSERPYIVVLMSKGVVEKEADDIIPELSKMVFDYETED